MNLKNKLKNQMLIYTLLSFLVFLFFLLRINVYIYTSIMRTLYTILFIYIMILSWRTYFSKNKKTIPINDWLEDFLEKHPDIHHDQALSYANIYVQKRVFILLISNLCMTLESLFIGYFAIIQIIYYELSFINLLILLFIILLPTISLFVYLTTKLIKKYYQSYLYQNCQLYIQMTYHLCNVPVFQKAILNYTSLLNISSALGRLGYYQEAYDYLVIWHQNGKRLLAITKLYYYEHCIAHLSMMKRSDEVHEIYQQFQSFYQKKSRLQKNKQVQKLVTLINIYKAYADNQKDTVIELEKDYIKTTENCPPQIESIFKWAHEEVSL